MSAVVSFVADVFEDVVDAVGDVVEAVGDVVEEVVDTVGDVVEAVVENPLPVLLSVAGAMVGIPPMLTNAVVTAASGGDLVDIALSVGTAYLAPVATNSISSTLSSTIGDAIVNEAVSDAFVNSVSKGLVNGVVAEIKNGDFADGFAGGFTGGMVGAGVTEVADFVKPEIVDAMDSIGLDSSTATAIANAGTKALTAGITSEITGRNDFVTSFTNSMVNSGANIAANSITNSISDQFNAVTLVDREITGAENGDTKDQEELKTELADAWDNRDINAVNNIITTNNITEDDARTLFDLTDSDIFGLADNGVTFSTGDADTKTTTDLTNTDTGTTIGTGAGIPDSLVDEVEVSDLGDNTGTATDVVSNLDTTYTTNDLAGTDSVSTINGADDRSLTTDNTDVVNAGNNSWIDVADTSDFNAELNARLTGDLSTPTEMTDLTGYEDLPDIEDLPEVEEISDTDVTTPTDTIDETEVFDDFDGTDLTDVKLDQDTLQQLTPEVLEQLPQEYQDIINKIDTKGDLDLTAVKSLEDAGVDQSVIDSLMSSTQPSVTGVPEGQPTVFKTGLEEEEKPVLGGLGSFGLTGSSLLPTAAGTGVMGSVLNQVLKPAIRQSITKSLLPTKKTPQRPRPAPQTQARRPTPVKMTPQQIAAMQKKPTTPTVKKPVAPTKANVKSLTPVTNIAGLTSILKKKG